MPRRPRLFEPHVVYDVTVQTVDREFLLKPTPEIRNLVGAAFARAQCLFPVKFHYGLTNVNHPHFAVSADENTLCYLEPFFNLSLSLIAREANRFWHRKGSFWSCRAHITPCVSDHKAEERLFYGTTNPMKDGLVDRLSHYPGFSTYTELARGEQQKYFYFDRTAWWKQGGPNGKRSLESFIQWVPLVVSPLPHWRNLTTSQQHTRFRKRLREYEKKFARERRDISRTAAGIPGLRELNHRDRPRTDKKRDVQPLCHASSPEEKAAYKEHYSEIQQARMVASIAFRQGCFDVEFPKGTFPPPLKSMYYASQL
jgi:hypothetical protein